MLAGSELEHLIQEFGNLNNISSERNEYKHNDEAAASQTTFLEQTKKLVATITEFGNPPKDNHVELLVLNSRVCADDCVIRSI